MKLFKKFMKNESGATAIEYGLIAALISVAILAALNDFGDKTEEMYNHIETSVINAG